MLQYVCNLSWGALRDGIWQVLILTKERDGLKAILESYDEEENVIASHQKPVTGIANLATPEKAKDLRIQVGR
jgi:hypothetical protein